MKASAAEEEKRQNKGLVLIFRAWRINPKTGEKEYAKDHGKKAWPIWVSPK